MFESLVGYDKKIARYLYFHRPFFADDVLLWLTNNATLITFAFVVLLSLWFLVKNKQKYLYVAINVFFIIGISAVFSNSIKLLVKRLRPYKVLDGVVYSEFLRSGGYSFPSGHTTEVFALMTAVFLLMRRSYLRWILLFWALLIAYTRMAFGLHYPLDIIGGMLVGSLTAYLWLLWAPLKPKFKKING